MIRAVPFVFLIASLILSASASLELRNRILYEQSRNISAKTPLRATALELKAEQDAAVAATSSLTAPAEAFAHRAAIFRRQSVRESLLERKVGSLCQSLSEMGRAIKLEPRNTRYLLYWADVRQMLADTDCSNVSKAWEYTKGSFSEVARFALASDPTNPQVLYASALLLGWPEPQTDTKSIEVKSEESYQLINRFLAVSQQISAEQQSYILSRLTSRQALKSAIPARFPQIATWATLLFQKDQVRFEHFAPVLSELEEQAIGQSSREVFSGAVSLDLHFNRMMSLFGLLQNSRIERIWSEEIIAIAERKIDSGATEFIPVRDHFRARLNTNSLPVVVGFRSSDTRPERSPLLNWDSNRNFDFGSFYGSLGFFLPPKRNISAIELYATRHQGQAALAAHSIRVFVSDDNRSWLELPQESKIETFNMLSYSIIAIRLAKPDEHRYWKIHYGSNDRSSTFSNELTSMLRAYGTDYSYSGGQ